MDFAQIALDTGADIELVGHAVTRVAPASYPQYLDDYTQEQWGRSKREGHRTLPMAPEPKGVHRFFSLIGGKEQITRGKVKGENVVYEG